MGMRTFAVAVLCAGISMTAASTAMAQDRKRPAGESTQGGQELDAIVVTARKRSESLQDVPVAVVAISEAKLQTNLASDLSKIAELAPQVTIGRSATGTGAVITIRGISSAAVDSGLDQSVSVSIDGVSLSRGRIIQTAMFDLRQVEVMQGPQALFFGKNSPAGVISLTSAGPTDSFEGYLRAGYEFTADEKYVEGAVSGPLSDTLKARLAGRFSDMKGWIRNVAQPGPNPFQPFAPLPGALQGKTGPKGHDASGRLSLVWEPSDGFSAALKATYSSERSNSGAAYSEVFCAGGTTTVPATLGVPQPDADCKANRVKSEPALAPQLAINYPNGNGGVPYQRSDMGLVSLALSKDFGDLSLVSTTGYYNQLHRSAANQDFSGFLQIYDAERERYEMVNEELRLSSDFSGPLNFMVGGYVERSNRHWENAPAILYFLNPATNNYATAYVKSDSRNDSYSVFGQLLWKIVPTLELAGGARYSHDRKRSTIVNLANNPAAPLIKVFLYPQDVPLSSRYSGNNVSPEVTLTWKPERDQTLYAAYKTGYKSGGISNPALLDTGFTSENLKFRPEKVKGFELGYKAELLDRRLRLDLVAYRYKYNNLQVTAYDSVNVRYSITNAASSRTTGVTGSFEYLATDRLSLNGNIGYNRARYLSFPTAQCYAGQTPGQGCVGGVQDLSGKPLNRAPKLTFNLGADYSAALGDNWKADFSASTAYSSSYQAATDYAFGGRQSAFWRVNAAVTIKPKDDRFEIALIGRNLTNRYYKTVVYSQPFGNFDQYAGFFSRPREVALQFKYNFGT